MVQAGLPIYLGVNLVHAMPADNNGKSGYSVSHYGHSFWVPKDVFEKHYFQINHEDKLTESDIVNFMEAGTVNTMKMGDKTTIVEFAAPTGFVEIDSSSCVSPHNYDEQLGRSICLDRIRNKMWYLLGFVLQWANKGLR